MNEISNAVGDIMNMRSVGGRVIRTEVHTAPINTSEVAKIRAEEGCPDGYSIIYCGPSHGKKGGKHDGAETISVSSVLRPSIFPSQSGFLLAMATVALIHALEEYTDSRIGVVWPSAVYCNGHRVGSAGIEGKLRSAAEYEYLIINFSVSVSQSDFPSRLGDIIKKVFSGKKQTETCLMADSILNQLFTMYNDPGRGGAFVNEYRERSLLRGHYVMLRDKNGIFRRAKVLGISKNTEIILENRDGSVSNVYSPSMVSLPKIHKKYIFR